MGAQSLVLRLSPSGSLPPLKDFKSSSFGSSAPCFVQTNRWCSMLANPLLYLSSCRTKYSRRTLLCEASSQKVEGFNADLGSSDSKPSRKNLAVFVSGGGSNFKAIHSATLNGSILGDVVVLVTNKQGCGGAAYARENNIPVVLFPRTKEESEGLSPEDLVTALSIWWQRLLRVKGA